MFEHLPGDHRGGGLDDGEPVVGVSFPAGGDAAPVTQPAVRPLDRPAVTAVWVAASRDAAAATLDHDGVRGGCFARAAAAADHRLDTALADPGSQLLAVVAAVCPQLRRPDLAREQLVEQRQQLAAFVLVAATDPDRERDPARVDDQVEAAARAASQRAADLAAPLFVSTSEASAIARDQSTSPSCSSSSCTRHSNCSHTPAARH